MRGKSALPPPAPLLLLSPALLVRPPTTAQGVLSKFPPQFLSDTRDHQRADWSHHKSSCAPFALRSSKTRGRHLVATRNIAQGDLIFQEPPLSAGAFQSDFSKETAFPNTKRASPVHSASLPWLSQTRLAVRAEVSKLQNSFPCVKMLKVPVAGVRARVRGEANPQGRV